jgi:hypothetical protein
VDVELQQSVYALDSTTIDLCLNLFPWARFRSTKAAIKLHTLLDLRGAIPSFIAITDGRCHDVNALDVLMVEPEAFYIMDRGYLDFSRLHTLHQAGAYFVIRARKDLRFVLMLSVLGAVAQHSDGPVTHVSNTFVTCVSMTDRSNAPPGIGGNGQHWVCAAVSSLH